jgi:leucyl-tRNA synthetase
MRKIVLTYGLISGTIVSAMMMITMPLYESGALKIDRGEIIGYTTMVVALSLIFFGIKSFRDNHLKGSITFGKATTVGLLITLIASLMYATSWEITIKTMKGDFVKQMTEKAIEKAKQNGDDEKAIANIQKQMDDFAAMYKNPFIRFSITVMEIAPVGILISLLSAAILRRKELLPTTNIE